MFLTSNLSLAWCALNTTTLMEKNAYQSILRRKLNIVKFTRIKFLVKCVKSITFYHKTNNFAFLKKIETVSILKNKNKDFVWDANLDTFLIPMTNVFRKMLQETKIVYCGNLMVLNVLSAQVDSLWTHQEVVLKTKWLE